MHFNITKKKLSLAEIIAFEDQVVKAAFQADEQGNLGEYSPILKEIAMKYYFIKYYTDYALSDDMEKDYSEYADIDYYDYDIALTQFTDLTASIHDRIAYLKKTRHTYMAASTINQLAANLEPLIGKMIGLVEKETVKNEAEVQLSKVMEELSKAQTKQLEYVNQVNEHLTPEELTAISKKYAKEETKLWDLQKEVVKNE